MDPHYVQKLTIDHQKGLSACLVKIAEWEKFKKDYEALTARLEILSDKISYNVTVPFGSLAFMHGYLIHTNEVMVYLGDDWFSEVSSKQAAYMANRRIRQCNEMLEKLSLEKTQFENWLKCIPEVTRQDLVEIIEEYDEEKETLWREQHTQNVQSYMKKKCLVRNATVQRVTNTSNTNEKVEEAVDEAYLQLLEKFTIEDTSKKEHSAAAEQNEPSSSESDSDDEDSSEDNHMDSDDDSSDPDEDGENECFESLKVEKKHVKWIDQVKPPSNQITFTHSQMKEHNSQGKLFNHSSTPPVILSPSDIYKSFQQTIEPQSILKKTHAINEPKQADNSQSKICDHLLDAKTSSSKVNQSKEEITEKQVAFSGEIVENIFKGSMQTSHRPVSRFKSSRKK